MTLEILGIVSRNIRGVCRSFIDFFLIVAATIESPTIFGSKASTDALTTTNELSAPYEVPQFPIEQIEKKLAVQRHLNIK